MSSSPTETGIEIVMPQMGVSVAEGTIIEWRKRSGDWVEADETVCVVTTDKVDVEIPSPASGRIGELLVPEGETVDVGVALATLDTAAQPGEAHPEESTEKEPGREANGKADSAEKVDAEDAPDRSRFYSPVVRRIADEHGIDLDSVEGTGIGGRVRKRDVLAKVEAGDGVEAAPAQPALHTESPYRPEPAPAANGAAVPAERREPMTPMRKSIAEHMLESRRTSAHCTTIVEADFLRVAAARKQLKEEMGRRGVPLTYLAFVATATVAALQRHPVLNASLDGDEIVYHEDVNLGIAVALDEGLIVPVIPKAQRLEPRGDGRGDRRRRRARAQSGAGARRRPRRHLHDHQPRPVRRGAGDPDHQPAAGGDPRFGSDRAPTRGRRPGGGRGDRGAADELPLHVLGPPRTRRRRGGALPRRRQGRPRGLEGRAVMALEHEELHVRRGERTGLYVIVAIHSTRLGPALGGARLWSYANPGDGVADALRLAEAMTYKAASAGLDLGGGKCVICAEGNLSEERRRELMLDLGDAVESLEGRYITAEDVGTGSGDMAIVAERTRHVVGLPPDLGGRGDPSPLTARGVEAAIRACVRHRFGDGELDGRSVCVIGLGHVGLSLAERLAAAGAELIVSDVDPAKRRAARGLGARWVDPAHASEADCDVLAPCALGGAVNEQNIDSLRCEIVCGSANNVLADEGLAAELDRRGILYAPDFIANAGGLINVYGELRGLDQNRVDELVDGIGTAIETVLAEAERSAVSPQQAARTVARRRLEPAQASVPPAAPVHA